MTIIYRTTGAWGAGKGSPLTNVEGDNNIYQIVTRLTAVEGAIPAAAVGISSISVTGDQMSIILSDATTEGPFTLPTTVNTYRGVWAAVTPYNKFDRFTKNGNLYEVLFPHTSALTFDPNANDGLGHNYYGLLLSNPGATLPAGGATGHLLAKFSNTDFDFIWQNPATLAIPFTTLTGIAVPAQIPVATTSAIGGVKRIAAVSHKFITSIDATGLPILAQPAFSDLSGSLSSSQVPPTPVGSTLSSGATFDITQANTYIPFSSGSNQTFTIPQQSSVAWVADTEITLRNVGVGLLTIVGGAGVTLNIPAGFLAKAYGQGATITIKRAATDSWDIFGLLATV